MCTMDELEFDMITDHTNDEKVKLEEELQEPEVVIIKSCCRCGDNVGQNKELFDSDSCVHNVCVHCRFRDDLRCLLCGPAKEATSSSTEITPNKIKDLFYSSITMFMPRKKFNKDHIVDVESAGESTGGVHKQMCTVCQRVFKKTNAPYHYACATGDKPFSCSECNQKFVKKSHMEAHLNSHYGIKPFKCSVKKCKASFYQKDKLIRHMKTHDKNVKHTCPVCDKQYASQAIMNLHLQKVHTLVKPFQCDLCPRSYKYKRSLRVHRLKHLAIREYMCEVCGKKYTLFSQLKHHKRSHVLYHRRPHKCSCGRRFMTRRDRARHELIHTASRNDFECSLCNTTFGRKDNLERHMKNFHQEDPPVLNKAKLTAVVTPFEKALQNNSSISPSKSNQLQTCSKFKETTKSKVKNKNFNKVMKKKNPQKINKRKKKTGKGTLETNGSQTENQTSIINNTPSVIVSPKPSDNQNRPSVIKTIPKLLPYRVLPPDKRFLKITEHLTKNKTISNVVLPSDLNTKSNINTLNVPYVTDVNTFNIPSVTDVNAFSIPSVIEINQNNCNLLSTQPNTMDAATSPMDNSGRKTPFEGKPSTSRNPRRRISKDDALNRCFRIICHTNRVEVEKVAVQNIPQRNTNILDKDLKAVINRPNKITLSSSKRIPSAKSIEQIECNQLQRPDRELGRYTSDIVPNSVIDYSMVIASQVPVSNVVGGPSLPTSLALPENPTEMNPEDFNNSYVPLSESCYSTYTPYFDNDCFRDNYYEASTEQLLHNDLDIGFQYINEQLSCAEMNFISDSRVVRYVSQETRVVKESFS